MTIFQMLMGTGLAAALLYAILGYRSHYGALSGRSRLYRTAGLGTIILLLILAVMWPEIDFYAGVPRQVGAIRQLCYLITCFILGLSLPMIALLDALETYVTVRRERRVFLEQMIQEEVERAKARKAAVSGETAGTSEVTEAGGS